MTELKSHLWIMITSEKVEKEHTQNGPFVSLRELLLAHLLVLVFVLLGKDPLLQICRWRHIPRIYCTYTKFIHSQSECLFLKWGIKKKKKKKELLDESTFGRPCVCVEMPRGAHLSFPSIHMWWGDLPWGRAGSPLSDAHPWVFPRSQSVSTVCNWPLGHSDLTVATYKNNTTNKRIFFKRVCSPVINVVSAVVHSRTQQVLCVSVCKCVCLCVSQ